MNSETRTSDEVSEYVPSSVSHSFRLKWKIPVNAFFDSDHAPRPVPKSIIELLDSRYKVMENSKLFSFKDLKMHPFSLVLQKHTTYLNFILKLLTNDAKDGPQLEYAFTSINGRLYYLDVSRQEIPTYMREQTLINKVIDTKKDHVTIVCGIRFVSTTSHSTSTEIDDDSYLLESSLPRDLPFLGHLTSWSTSSSTSSHEAFVKYSLTGLLPSLDWKLAYDILFDLHRGKKDCPELKAMCVEFLGRNLSPANIVAVMKMACENHEEYLLSQCYEFLAKKCNIVRI